MNAIAAIVVAAALVASLFAMARMWGRRHNERVTARDPVFWVTAGLTCTLAGTDAAHAVPASIVLATCSVCAATDRQTGYIFDVVVAGAGAMLVGYAAATFGVVETASGCAICAGAVLMPYLATRGRGIGLGDVKLAALIGAGLGVRGGLLAIGAAFVAGAILAIVGLSCGRLKRGDVVRFAPYLAAGSLASVALYGAP